MEPKTSKVVTRKNVILDEFEMLPGLSPKESNLIGKQSSNIQVEPTSQ